ncbi:MAG TPA: D-alanyl-D-alanine carboxypeptidase family protein, partial [Alphaproteobacteria bacterium]|nr:D-alanyl-D-alanine carboxypeptidase family protein [Alphaproteobacteria bacterium]
IVQSGNDASVVVAEALAGSEAEFARRMTERAKELGLTNTNFVNATGWPDPDHYSTARDLALLAEHLIVDFPQYYHYYSQLEFTWNGIKQGNRNPLLYKNMNVDGLKTGHTEAAGYGLTASAERDGRRLILVVNGLPDVNARSEEGERLIEWGFREFDTYTLFDAGETVETAAVWQGDPATVPLVPASDVAMTLRRAARDDLKVAVRVTEPVSAPVAKGQAIATLVVSVPGVPDREIPLIAGADVERQGFFGRVYSSAKALVFGVFDRGEEIATAEAADGDAAVQQ